MYFDERREHAIEFDTHAVIAAKQDAATGAAFAAHHDSRLNADGRTMIPHNFKQDLADSDALADAVGDDTAAVFLEPILGEGGVVVPPDGYLAEAREITRRHGALLAIDEVQTGVGRTGQFFAHQHDAITPDIVTLAKGLGGGLPIGACLASGPAAELMTPGMHGSTFGGNPVSAAAACAVLRVLDEENLMDNADAVGKKLQHGIESLAHPLVDYVRGRGLLRGLVLTAPHAKAVELAARDAGFLVNAAAPDVIRLAPPLIITADQIDGFVAALPGILDAAEMAARV